MLIIVIIIFGGIIGWYFFKQAMIAKYMSKYVEPAVTVTTAKVESVVWSPFLTSIGTLKPQLSVQISPELGGVINAIHFQSGDYVKKGQPLVDLDSSNQIALLQADQAQLKLLDINYKRDARLFKHHAISAADFDADIAKLQAQQATVDGDIATLAKMHIVAPFSGKLGIREVSAGQYVAPQGASNNIVTLNSVDPILVQFNLDQQDLPKIQLGQTVELTVDAYPGKVFMGAISAINASVDPNSRAILVEATLANAHQELVGGMFATVQVRLPVQENVLAIPQSAIVYSLYGDSVYVVQPDKSVKQTFVTLGQTHGLDIAITKGLTAGAQIVTSGQLKLRNGVKIEINNSVLPN
jgi:membrane fusion protein (multidrug efflux system)